MSEHIAGAMAGIVTVPSIWYYIRTLRIRKARSA